MASHSHPKKPARATARRSGMLQKQQPEDLMGAIKQLEKQVQMMERNYLEQLRMRASKKVTRPVPPRRYVLGFG